MLGEDGRLEHRRRSSGNRRLGLADGLLGIKRGDHRGIGEALPGQDLDGIAIVDSAARSGIGVDRNTM